MIEKAMTSIDQLGGVVDALVAEISKQMTLDEECDYKVRLVSKELITNCFLHAKAHSVRLRAECKSSRLMLCIEDDSNGFLVNRVLNCQADALKMPLRENGRGSFLVKYFTEQYSYNECGNAVTVTILLRPDK